MFLYLIKIQKNRNNDTKVKALKTVAESSIV